MFESVCAHEHVCFCVHFCVSVANLGRGGPKESLFGNDPTACFLRCGSK